MTPEYIIYVDDAGNPTGETAEKYAAHNAHTRKHLAFSIYLFDAAGKFLMTKRADVKKVWPGVLTNSCCGHPLPGESITDTITRRCLFELGVTEVHDIKCVIDDYSYITPPYKGIVENEFCPVFLGRIDSAALTPNSDEVSEVTWLSWDDYLERMNTDPELFSYWTKQQAVLIDSFVREYIA